MTSKNVGLISCMHNEILPTSAERPLGLLLEWTPQHRIRQQLRQHGSVH